MTGVILFRSKPNSLIIVRLNHFQNGVLKIRIGPRPLHSEIIFSPFSLKKSLESLNCGQKRLISGL